MLLASIPAAIAVTSWSRRRSTNRVRGTHGAFHQTPRRPLFYPRNGAIGCLREPHVTQKAQKAPKPQKTPNTPECSESPECSEVKAGGRDHASHDRQSSGEDLEEIIKQTMPTAPRQRHRQIFRFVLRIKAIPELADLPADDLQEHVEKWHRAAKKHIRTKDFEATWADFVFAWEECRGGNPMTALFEQAIASTPPKAAVEKYGEHSRRTRLVKVCRALQQREGDQPFFLSTRQAAELLEVSPKHASRWLKRLTADGFLQLVRKGSLAGRLAAEFRYTGED